MDLTPEPPKHPTIVPLRPHQAADLEITLRRDEEMRRCSGRHRQIVVDETTRTAICETCGHAVDPFEYILDWAKDVDRRLEGLKRITLETRLHQAEVDSLKRQARSLRDRLKRGGRPQDAREKAGFERLHWNPQMLGPSPTPAGLVSASHPVEYGPMPPNRESVDARHFTDWDLAEAHGPGAFVWCVEGARRSIVFCLPGEDFGRSIQVVHGPPPGEHVWGWDGNVERPTLQPSILAWDRESPTAKDVVWHGYLTDGRFVSC